MQECTEAFLLQEVSKLFGLLRRRLESLVSLLRHRLFDGEPGPEAVTQLEDLRVALVLVKQDLELGEDPTSSVGHFFVPRVETAPQDIKCLHWTLLVLLSHENVDQFG